MPQASGFKCPKCKNDKLSDVLSKDLVHILELKCKACGAEFAVESSTPVGGYMNAPYGKVGE